MNSRLIFPLIFLSMALTCYSQLQIGAELRPRVLLDNGYVTPRLTDEPPRMFLTQRTRFNILFKSEFLETFISIQDVRTWGGDNNFKSSGTYGNTGSISLHQGWVLLKPARWFSLKVGRQLLSYDDQRIISSRGWNDSQVTYDAILARAGDSLNRVDMGLTWNTEADKYAVISPNKFKTFDFIRYQRTQEKLKFSFLALLTGNTLSDSVNQVRYGATYGTNFNFTGSRLGARGSFYYQHHLNQLGGKVSAFCASVNIGIPLIDDRMKCSVGYDYISGQDEVRKDADYIETDHSFNLLYGRRHGWYGYMDYFSSMPAQGLQDYILRTEFALSEGFLLLVDYHYFRLAAPMLNPELQGIVVDKQLGHELDLTLKWTISKEAVLQAGYSFMAIDRTMKFIKQVHETQTKLPRFAYLMLTISPGFSLDKKTEITSQIDRNSRMP